MRFSLLAILVCAACAMSPEEEAKAAKAVQDSYKTLEITCPLTVDKSVVDTIKNVSGARYGDSALRIYMNGRWHPDREFPATCITKEIK